jgi:hypothetical protein
MDAESVAFMKQAGCRVDNILLADNGIYGDGNLMVQSMNSRQVFEVVRDWLKKSVATPRRVRD